MKAEKPTPNPDDIELHPDAWGRFERFMKRLVKAGPQHRAKPKARPTSKGRGHKGKA